jgi:asparagine synthase (glutamine-hydrolysing)
MCGILCLTNVRSNSIIGLKSLHHRGPDSNGFWISPKDDFHHISIGHSRLSIIDQSDSANQPMLSSCGRYVIAFNGEIYNFQDLKSDLIKEGCVFRTESDTEVLLQGLILRGHDFLNKCNGMWAFLFWDRLSGELLFSRDRYGKKPLYYVKNKLGYVFASEIKALYPYIDDISFASQLDGMFSNPFGYESTDRTFIKNLFRVPPGHYGCVKDGNFKVKRWWCTLDHLQDVPIRYEEQVEQFKEIFLDSVKLRMISDAPTATMLSGGLDSSVVFCSVNSMRNKQVRSNIDPTKLAYTSHFPGSTLDELHWAEKAIEDTDVKLNTVTLDASNISYDMLSKALLTVEDPYITLPIPMLQSYEMVSKAGVKVTIDGHGADELFSGYNTIQYAIAKGSLSEVKEYSKIFRSLSNNLSSSNIGLISASIYKARASAYSKAKYMRDIMRGDEYLINEDRHHENYKRMDLFSKKLYELFHMTILPTLLRNYDRYSMSSGVEIRMPFMDYRLVNYCFSLPLSSKLGGGFTKRILRDSMRGIVPQSILERKDKIGWNAPLHEWLQGRLGREILDQLSAMNQLDVKKSAMKLSKYIANKDSEFIDGQKLWAEIQPILWRDITSRSWASVQKVVL